MWLSFIVLIGYSTGEYFHVNTVFMVHAHAFDLLISVKLSFFYFFSLHLRLSPMDGVHDPGSGVPPIISIIPHHPLLPVWAQRGPHRSACGPHHLHTAHCPRAALHLLCGLLPPPAEPADSHDERHPLEGGAGARRALEDSGIRRVPQEDTGRLSFRNAWALITQLLLPVTGGCYNVNAGEEAASLPVASARSVRPRVRSEGTLVSQVRQSRTWWKTRGAWSSMVHY